MTLADKLAELKAAGVEVPEVDNALACWERGGICQNTQSEHEHMRLPCRHYDDCTHGQNNDEHDIERAAISALIALVLKYKAEGGKWYWVATEAHRRWSLSDPKRFESWESLLESWESQLKSRGVAHAR
jgi:hypothetical protein